MKNSLFKDYKEELHRKFELMQTYYKRKWLQNGKRNGTETFIYTAKSLNKWCVIAEFSQHGASFTPYIISYSSIGITALYLPVSLEKVSFLYFTTHFFKRYRERGKINIDKPEALVKDFFKKNSAMLPCYLENDDGSTQLFTPLHNGVGLGIHHADEDIFEFKTFVDSSLLKKNQIQEINQIYTDTLNEMNKELEKIIANHYSKKNSYF